MHCKSPSRIFVVGNALERPPKRITNVFCLFQPNAHTNKICLDSV